MAVRRPDIVEIVVLPADAHHLLRRRGAPVVARLAPEKQVLELVHAGVGEQESGVVAGDQRRTRHDAVAVLLEVLQEGRPDLVRGHPAILSDSTVVSMQPDAGLKPCATGDLDQMWRTASAVR